jgi:hypothetical protein
MNSKHLHLKDSGIFKNLPNFSPDIKGLTAIIMGTTGISGFHAVRVLLESLHRWKEVYAHPSEMMAFMPEEHRSRVQRVALDFPSMPKDTVNAMMGISTFKRCRSWQRASSQACTREWCIRRYHRETPANGRSVVLDHWCTRFLIFR